ncbi:extracellular solute-binding protein (plasmid) [Sinorhizobium meliloti]|nr:extracellular solute-binding protein [Sinorhizobium meliloti]
MIWPAEYATNNVLLDVTDRVTDEMNKGVLPEHGRLWNMTANVTECRSLDTKYLFYNKEILDKPVSRNRPKTWEELAEQAKAIKDKGCSKARSPGAGLRRKRRSATTRRWSAPMAANSSTRQAGLHHRRRARCAELHGNELHVGAHQPELERIPRGGCTGRSSRTAKPPSRSTGPTCTISPTIPRRARWPARWASFRPRALPARARFRRSTAHGLGITRDQQAPGRSWKYIVHMTSQETQNDYAKLSLRSGPPPMRTPSDEGPGGTDRCRQARTCRHVSAPTTPKYQELSTALQQAIQEALLGQSSAEDALKSAAENSGL